MLSPEEFANRPAHQRIGVYLMALVGLGAGGGIVIFLLIMQMLGWPLNISSTVAPVARLSAIEVVLFRSPTTERYFASVQGSYDVLLKPWRAYAKASGIDVFETSDAEGLKPRRGQVLVVPSAVALSDAEKASLLRFREAGGNVLLTWASGTRNPAGEWSGWTFLKQLSGFQLVSELPDPDAGEAHHLVTRGEEPVTHLLASGTRIRLGRPTERPIVFKGGPIGAEALVATVPNDLHSQEGLVLYQEWSTPNPSRVAVLGIAETSWDYQLEDIHRLVSGVLGWLARQPALFHADWPQGKRAAYVMAMEMTDKPQSVQSWLAHMAEKKYIGSVLMTATSARQFSDVLQPLANKADWLYAGDTSVGFKDQSANQQQRRIRSMIEETAAVLQKKQVLLGFKAPMNSFDAQTQQSLYEAGIRYQWIDGRNHTSRRPFFANIKAETVGQRFVVMPITLPQTSNGGVDEPLQLRQIWLSDVSTLRRQGGLGGRLFNSDRYQSDGMFEKNIPLFLEQMQKQSAQIWVSHATEVATWWQQRERLRLNIRPFGGRIEFDITILGEQAFQQATLMVVLPEKDKLPEVNASKIGLPPPHVELLDAYRAVIKFDELPPGDYSYQINF